MFLKRSKSELTVSTQTSKTESEKTKFRFDKVSNVQIRTRNKFATDFSLKI